MQFTVLATSRRSAKWPNIMHITIVTFLYNNCTLVQEVPGSIYPAQYSI